MNGHLAKPARLAALREVLAEHDLLLEPEAEPEA
jgi:hypothetical protein